MNKIGALTIESMIQAVLFALGLYIYLVLIYPINTNLLFPQLRNSEITYLGGTVELFFRLIPFILVMLIIFTIIKPDRTQPTYGG